MIFEWVQSPLLDRIGWSLVHFLWQGAAVAALLFLALKTIPIRKANVRYLAACAGLLIAFAAPLITFSMIEATDEAASGAVMVGVTSSQGATDSERLMAPNVVAVIAGEEGSHPSEGSALIRRRAESFLPLVVIAWLAGVSALSIRLGFGWLSLQILKRSQVAPLPYWSERVAALQTRMGIRRFVRVVESGRVTVPSTLGCWRPLILLPACALSGLTPAQIEAVLLHELAHIRRHDYVVNLLQSFIETALFYHPAVWWISRQIRNERENCCDDAAVTAAGNRVEYARALTSLEEVRGGASLQMAAGGGDLTTRVRRLLGAPPRTGALGGWMASLITLGVVSAVIVVGQVQNPNAEAQVPEANGSPLIVDPADTTAIPPLNITLDPDAAPASELEGADVSKIGNGQSEQIQIEISLSEIPEQLAFELGFAMPAKEEEHAETSPDSKDLGLRPSTTTAILTPAQFSKLIKILEVTSGVDILTAPKMTTLSGREGQVKVMELKTIVSGLDVNAGQTTPVTSKAELGPSINIQPMILENGRAIRLNVSSDVTEFLGYDDPGDFVPGDRPVTFKGPLPRFRVRQISGSGIVYDSQTLALLGCRSDEVIKFKDKVPVLGDIPLMGRFFRSESTQIQTKYLLILVTPTRIHPTGEPVFPAEPSWFDRSVPPPQYQIRRSVE